MAASGVPVLWQFRASHFNEKVRWALDWKGIRHERRSLLPGPHVPVVMMKTGQKQVPVLQLDGKMLPDSTAIIAELERRYPERPLYPSDPAARERALALEELFDAEIGPHVRRCVFHAALPHTDFVVDLFGTGFSTLARTMYRASFPLTRTIMRMDMGITDEATARSLERLSAILERLEQELQPSGYLVGDTFTVADLTAAALLTPLTFPAEYPYPTPPLPTAVRDFQAHFDGRRGFQWARDMYRRHRGASVGLDV